MQWANIIDGHDPVRAAESHALSTTAFQARWSWSKHNIHPPLASLSLSLSIYESIFLLVLYFLFCALSVPIKLSLSFLKPTLTYPWQRPTSCHFYRVECTAQSLFYEEGKRDRKRFANVVYASVNTTASWNGARPTIFLLFSPERRSNTRQEPSAAAVARSVVVVCRAFMLAACPVSCMVMLPWWSRDEKRGI